MSTTKYHYYESANLSIDRNGDWFNNGEKVVHEKIFQLFNRSLRPDGNGGFRIEINGETCPVSVERTPFVARGVYFENDENGCDIIWLSLNDGRTERLDARTLRLSGRDEVICRVFDGVFEAGFAPAAMTQLGIYIERDGQDERLFIELNGERFYIG